MLNVVLLITCVFTVILVLLYLFYWNRVLALGISILLRIAFWNQAESSIWLDIGSIQFSVIAGRIAFKDLRYYSSNQTIRVVKGQISWRYWIRRPAEEDDLSHTHVLGEDPKQTVHLPLSCRVHLSLQGFEWFIYNRTASYDNILSQMTDDVPPTPAPTPVAQSVGVDARGTLRKIFSKTSAVTGRGVGPSLSLASSLYLKAPSHLKRLLSWVRLQLPNFDPKNLLPMGLEVSKGAIICGNASTPNLLISEFSEAQGTYGIVQARSKYDLYKQLLNLRFENASVHYFENADFDASMGEAGRKLREHIERNGDTHIKHPGFLTYAYYDKLWTRLKLWSFEAAPHQRARSFLGRLLRQRVPIPHPPTSWAWWRSDKTPEDETPIGIDFSKLEYATERKILEAPMLELLYYADVVGVVPAETSQPPTDNLDPFDIGNGDLPPEWGIDFVIKGGFLRYGPWADRQRSILQSCFFPSTFHDTEPAARLKPGDMRTWTGLKVFMELRDGVTLHVPFREASKDWQWDGIVDVPDRPRKREAAFIHVKAGDSSTITYIMPMVARATGYDPLLEVHLDTVTITSSLNDMRLLTAQSCRIRCQLPTPLKWNGERTWTFSILLRSTQLFLLRDHINMLTDMGKDWSSGPPSDFYRFIPMHYVVELDLHGYEVNTYVNDHNIIDKPLIKEDNSILALHGLRLSTVIQLPLVRFRPADNTVSFRLEAPSASVRLTLPRWNTYCLSPNADRSNVGHIGLLTLDGSYRYHADVREYNVDQLKLDFAARNMVYKVFGWTVRHFMVLRENYFGSFTHFCTLFEYLEKRRKGQPITDPIEIQYRPGKSNALEVEVGFCVDTSLFVLPAGLPGFEQFNPSNDGQIVENHYGSCLLLNCPILQVQLRTNDYFMEMSLNVDTLFGDLGSSCTDQFLISRLHERDLSNSAIVLDGLDITANRLFGPQPKASTYVCIWETHLESVKASLSAHQAQTLSAAGDSFVMNFSDPLNAPAKEFALPIDLDVTFLKLTLGSAYLVWLAADSAVELALPDGLRLDSNDLAGRSYMKVTSIRIPTGTVKALNQTREHSKDWHDTAGLTFDINLDMYAAPPGWRSKADRQRAFVNAQDVLTGRASCLYAPEDTQSTRHMLPSGRGIVDSDVYLPQLRVPHRRTHGRSKPEPSHQPATNLGLRRLQPAAQSSHLSESEGDDGFAEVARDARVANSRLPGTKKLSGQTAEEDSLLSGDESDDEDLTESVDCDSDGSMESNLGTERPMVSQYREVIGHYKAPSVRRPAMWDCHPFTLSTRPRVSWRQRSQSGERSLITPVRSEAPCSTHTNDEEQLDITIIRMLCSRGCNVWVTPLAFQTVDALIEDLSCKPLTPELRLDSMMIGYIRSSLHASDTVRKKLAIDAQICSLTAAYGQFGAKEALRQNTPSSQSTFSIGLSQPEIFSTVQVSLQNGTWRHIATDHAEKNDSSPLKVSFHQLSVVLINSDGRQDKRSASSRKSPSPIAIGVTLAASTASLAPGQAALSLGTAVFNVREHALCFAKSFVASFTPHLDYALGLQKIYAAHHTQSTAIHIAYRVLKYSRRRPVVDPLSTIQPSYLVQKGLPDELRRSSCFKFLVHLRSCLRSLEATERLDVLNIRPNNVHPGVTMRDLSMLLENQDFSQTVDDDMAGLPRHPFMEKIFDAERTQVAKAPRRGSSLPLSGSLHLDALSLIIDHDVDDEKSTLFIGPLDACGHVDPCAFLPSPHVASGKGYGNLAATEKGSKDLLRIASSIKLQKIDFTITPRMVVLVKDVIRFSGETSKVQPAKVVFPSGSPASPVAALLCGAYLDLTISLQSARFAAAAAQLLVEFSVSGLGFATTTFSRPRSPIALDAQYSMNHSLLVDETALRVRPWGHIIAPSGSSTLASFLIHRSRLNVALLKEPHQALALRVVSCIDNVELRVPSSALNLYRSLDDWKEAYLSDILITQDHLHSPVPTERAEQDAENVPRLRFSLQLFCGSAGVTLQVARGTWFSWKVKETAMDLASSDNADQILPLSFGLQAGPHVIGISTTAPLQAPCTPTSRIEVELPMVTVKGTYSTNAVHGISLVETFYLTVKPADWDTLLSVYQKSEQGFSDLVRLNQETRPRSQPTAAPTPTSSGGLKLSGSFRMKGFRIGVEGHSSTVFLECDDIGGSMGSQADFDWQIRLSDLSLSLASRSSSRSALDRGHRSAFVTIDFEARMRCVASRTRHILEVLASKVHAVMQPTSIGELSDFIDNLQVEVFARQADRAQELAQFKEKTKNIMKSFDVKSGNTNDEQKSWLGQYNIYLTMRHIGVAFPLAAFPDLQMSRSGSRDDTTTVRAFLFSIKSLDFGTEHGENGDATMKGFSFQFVSRFRQSVSADFGGENHHTQNKLLYPQMTAQARSDRSGGARRLHITANVSGFILDLDPSIPHYVFSLVDVYRQGRERMDQLANNMPWSSDKMNAVKLAPAPVEDSRRDSSLPSSNMLLALTFASGKVRMHSTSVSESTARNRKTSGISEHLDDFGSDAGVESFDLPVVTVWGEYRASAGTTRAQRAEPSALMFKATIHSSQNTLRPTLLPFVTKIVSHVENRLRQSSRPLSQVSPATIQHLIPDSSTSSGKVLDSVDPVSGLKISFGLRIDQSKLELTCQPDVNVIAGLHWDSGGFIVNISPGFRRISFTGSVAGLTIGLKHGFLSEDCVKLDARNLAFNVTFAKTDVGSEKVISTISVIIDTEFSGSLRFSRLQDVLCFKAVWLDRIPVLSGPVATPMTPQGPAPQTIQRPAPTGQELTTAVLLRFRRVNLDADLGQSISYVKLCIENMVVRTKLSDVYSELTLAIVLFKVIATGNVSGQVTAPDFEFQTVRHSEGKDGGFAGGRMLDLTMRSGVFNVDLESEYQKLIQYRAEPVEVKIYDDWSMISPSVSPEKRHVNVAFTVSGTEVIIVMNVGTIPKLLSYADKFKATLDNQREGASKESKAFRIANSPKPDNPLSAVANAMLKSTRSRLREDTGVNYKIGQRMSLRLDVLRLVVFPRSMRDAELAQFVGRDVHARLDRMVEVTALPAKRDLELSFSSIATSRISQLNHALLSKENVEDSKQWLETLMKDTPEATIFGLPSMDIHMNSEEDLVSDRRTLVYDFSSKFSVKEGAKNREDIYITLNMSLYTWLTSLRKAFTREMQQVQASGDVRGGPLAMVQQAASSRKRTAEAAVAAMRADKDLGDQATSTQLSGRPPPLGRVAALAVNPSRANSPTSPTFSIPASPMSPMRFASPTINGSDPTALSMPATPSKVAIVYEPRERHIERLTMRQLGEATPDVMHPFFMKKAGFSIEDSLPQYVHEYATMPTEEIMKALLKLYSKQLTSNQKDEPVVSI